MRVIIPSRGRPMIQQQITADHLINAGVPFEWALSRSDERQLDYPVGVAHAVHVFDSKSISEKRAFILDLAAAESSKVLMIDDDIHVRRVEDDGSTRIATPFELRDAVEMTDHLLDKYAMVSMADRFMIQTKKRPFEMNARARVWVGLNPKLMPVLPVYDRISTLQDVDCQFQLLEMGCATVNITSFCFQDVKSWGEGGCSHYRTPELNRKNHELLRDLWPKYVELKPAEKLGDVKSVIQFRKAAKELIPLGREKYAEFFKK